MKPTRSRVWILFLVVALVFLGACGKTVSRRAVAETIDLSGKWNDTDSRLVAQAMIKDSLAFPWIDQFVAAKKKPPVVITFGVKNRTSEHINTQTFMKDLERAFLLSGRVKIVASREQRGEIRGERSEQQMGFTKNPAAIGKELGADFVLTGVLNSIRDRAEGEEVIFYQANLELISVESNEKVWIGDHKIKKLVKRSKAKPF